MISYHSSARVRWLQMAASGRHSGGILRIMSRWIMIYKELGLFVRTYCAWCMRNARFSDRSNGMVIGRCCGDAQRP